MGWRPHGAESPMGRRPHGPHHGAEAHGEEALSVDGHRLSVCPVPVPKFRTGGHSKLKIAGWKPMTRVTHDPI